MKYRLNLKFSDNSTCEVDSTLIVEHFEDVRRGLDNFHSSDVFYPGQKLRGPMRFLKNASWSYCSEDLKRAKDRKVVTAVVTEVAPSVMIVQWQWQTPECPLETPPENIEWQKNPPPDHVEGETLKRVKTLNLFESCTVQLGDVNYYTPKSSDEFMEKVNWRKMLPQCSPKEELTVVAQTSTEGKEETEGVVPTEDGTEPMDTGEKDLEKNNNSVAKTQVCTTLTSS